MPRYSYGGAWVEQAPDNTIRIDNYRPPAAPKPRVSVEDQHRAARAKAVAVGFMLLPVWFLMWFGSPIVFVKFPTLDVFWFYYGLLMATGATLLIPASVYLRSNHLIELAAMGREEEDLSGETVEEAPPPLDIPRVLDDLRHIARRAVTEPRSPRDDLMHLPNGHRVDRELYSDYMTILRNAGAGIEGGEVADGVRKAWRSKHDNVAAASAAVDANMAKVVAEARRVLGE